MAECKKTEKHVKQEAINHHDALASAGPVPQQPLLPKEPKANAMLTLEAHHNF
ncbi:hypothetical protein RSAG8_11450, partial [Rhizoctonia solani AG-8 WAC10335]